jgi:HAE1 family hydrophobic/amphiphilic exporter-1
LVFTDSFNFMSLLGLFLTIGVGINDGILKAEGVKYFLKIGYTLNNAIASSSATRFRPILFTTLTTTLGLTPIFFQSQSLSKIIFLNFSIPVIFGVITSTLYTILFLNSSLKWAFLEEYKK